MKKLIPFKSKQTLELGKIINKLEKLNEFMLLTDNEKRDKLRLSHPGNRPCPSSYIARDYTGKRICLADWPVDGIVCDECFGIGCELCEDID